VNLRRRPMLTDYQKPTRFSLEPTRFHTINRLPAAKPELFANLDSSDSQPSLRTQFGESNFHAGSKALIAVALYGTAKAVPFVREFFRSLLSPDIDRARVPELSHPASTSP
jgi:predicted membrane metal-binding protein